MIAAHATQFKAATSSLVGLVRLAAGAPDYLSSRRIGADPAALLRFFDCDYQQTVTVLSGMLRDEDPWMRADAAAAAEKLVAARPAVGSLLLTALLDSLEHPDKSRHAGDPFAASQVARVVADTLVANPAGTDRRLNARLQRAEPGYAKRLWRCYYYACRNSLDGALPRRVVNTIVRRSVRLLEKDSDLELLREIADHARTCFAGIKVNTLKCCSAI